MGSASSLTPCLTVKAGCWGRDGRSVIFRANLGMKLARLCGLRWTGRSLESAGQSGVRVRWLSCGGMDCCASQTHYEETWPGAEAIDFVGSVETGAPRVEPTFDAQPSALRVCRAWRLCRGRFPRC